MVNEVEKLIKCLTAKKLTLNNNKINIILIPISYRRSQDFGLRAGGALTNKIYRFQRGGFYNSKSRMRHTIFCFDFLMC